MLGERKIRQTSTMIRLCASILSIIAASSAFTPSIQIKTHRHQTLLKSSQLAGIGQPTEVSLHGETYRLAQISHLSQD